MGININVVINKGNKDMIPTNHWDFVVCSSQCNNDFLDGVKASADRNNTGSVKSMNE